MNKREDGNIIIFMSILMVLTLLVAAMLVEVRYGLRTTRRAGDSANALQVADAGINDATQAIATAATNSFSRTGSVGSGSFAYTATRDTSNTAIWHIDATGTDARGVKRRLVADASGVSEYTSPMFIRNLYTNGAGQNIDSYYSGLNVTTACTRKGIISITDGSNMNFTASGGGNENCTGKFVDTTWNYGIDGCFVYDKDGTAPLPPTGPAKCPNVATGYTKIIQKTFPAANVDVPVYDTTGSVGTDGYFPVPGGDATKIGKPVPQINSTFTCDSSTPIQSGYGYYYKNVVLLDGCKLAGTILRDSRGRLKPAKVYGQNITIGGSTGSNALVNPPSAAQCNDIGVSTAGWSYSDIANNPSIYYCSGWSQLLQVFIPDTVSGSMLIQQNNSKLWAIINAPSATVTLKSPGFEMWGAMVAGSADVKNQFSWHYDETLSQVTFEKYQISNWRECGLTGVNC